MKIRGAEMIMRGSLKSDGRKNKPGEPEKSFRSTFLGNQPAGLRTKRQNGASARRPGLWPRKQVAHLATPDATGAG